MSSAGSLNGSKSDYPTLFNNRLRDIFPPGFDSAPTGRNNRSHYRLAPDQLYRALTDSYDPVKRVGSIMVKSAWYGRRSSLAKQEFILLKVEDIAIEGLTNYIVLDRGTSTPSSVFSVLLPHSRVRFHGEMARDTFKISYDGNRHQLLRECNLEPYGYLETLEFQSDEPLLLYQLSTLVHIISDQYPQYRFADINGSWFARLTWECMRQIRTRATHIHIDQGVKRRGKLSWTPQFTDSARVAEACQAFQRETQELARRFSEQDNSSVIN